MDGAESGGVWEGLLLMEHGSGGGGGVRDKALSARPQCMLPFTSTCFIYVHVCWYKNSAVTAVAVGPAGPSPNPKQEYERFPP